LAVFKLHHYVPKVLDYLCEGSIFLYCFLIAVNAILTISVDKKDKTLGTQQLFNIIYFSTPCLTLLNGRNSWRKAMFRGICFSTGVATVIMNDTLIVTVTESVFGMILVQLWVEITISYMSSAMDRLII
jgi:hypothetical protein